MIEYTLPANLAEESESLGKWLHTYIRIFMYVMALSFIISNVDAWVIEKCNEVTDNVSCGATIAEASRGAAVAQVNAVGAQIGLGQRQG